jgi:hypothetical protein
MSVVKRKPKVGGKRRIGDAVFKMIVEMAYEMKYANRYCEAERTNRFAVVPPCWLNDNVNKLPFQVETKDYEELKIGDIVINLHRQRNAHWYQSRLAKVIRINKKSVSMADCDQEGRLVEYNPDDDCDFPTKEARKDYNKLFPHFRKNPTPIIVGTKHLRYDGWDT